MLKVSNAKAHNGASAILNKKILKKLANDIGSDLYILPSSIHEILCVSTEIMSVSELAQMVYDVNMSQVDLSDRLSNQVYLYKISDDKVTKVTNALEALEEKK